jgi:hypothetical protein
MAPELREADSEPQRHGGGTALAPSSGTNLVAFASAQWVPTVCRGRCSRAVSLCQQSRVEGELTRNRACHQNSSRAARARSWSGGRSPAGRSGGSGRPARRRGRSRPRRAGSRRTGTTSCLRACGAAGRPPRAHRRSRGRTARPRPTRGRSTPSCSRGRAGLAIGH